MKNLYVTAISAEVSSSINSSNSKSKSGSLSILEIFFSSTCSPPADYLVAKLTKHIIVNFYYITLSIYRQSELNHIHIIQSIKKKAPRYQYNKPFHQTIQYSISLSPHSIPTFENQPQCSFQNGHLLNQTSNKHFAIGAIL